MARRLIVFGFILIIGIGLVSCKKRVQDFDNIADEREYMDYQVEDEGDSSNNESLNQETSPNNTPARAADSLAIKSNYSWSSSGVIPPVVIIVDDFGYTSGDLLQDFAGLPPEVVFAVLPDLPQTRRSAELASQHGHEVIIHIPMEARGNRTSPGERYISSNMSAPEIQSLLSDFYEQMPMAIAANNHMGSTTTADPDLMNPVLDHLNHLGLFFIDSAVSTNRLSYNLAKQKGYRTYRRDIFLDVPDNSDATIVSKIESLGRYKNRLEPIVVITHCHNRAKLVALQKFINQIQALGIRIMSLNQVRQYMQT